MNLKSVYFGTIAVFLATVWPSPGQLRADDRQTNSALSNPFYAFCIDTHDSKKRTLAEQAEMLKELGYDGVGHLWLDHVPERLRTLDEAGLELFNIAIRVNISPEVPAYDPRLKEVVPLLKGRNVVLTATVSNRPPSPEASDARAVEILREIADLAGHSGVRVAIYPHTGDWVARVDHAVRLAKQVERANVGVIFNLCHWLRNEDPATMRPLLKSALPYLFLVSINGADTEGVSDPNWDRLIQPLDRGSFDLEAFLRTLKDLGYQGPIALMCYGIRGDAREHLSRSMTAWKRLCEVLKQHRN